MGWLWYLGTLVPVIGLVQVGLQAHADRYTYVPQIGLALMIAWGAADLAGSTRRGRGTLAAMGSCALAALAFAASLQVAHWRNSVTLFERALAVTETNFYIQHMYGRYLFEIPVRLDEAKPHFLASIRARPSWPHPRLALADLHVRRGEFAAAIERYEEALRLAPQYADAEARLAFLLIERGRPAEALLYFASLRRLPPGALAARFELWLGWLRPGADAADLRRRVAWLLATAEDADVRNPAEALRMAEAGRDARLAEAIRQRPQR